ncbi:MAG: GFA family protein [bacterium]
MYRASCLCGDITWNFTRAPQFMVHCHCGRCRKMHGSAFATYVGGPAQDVTIDGEAVRFKSSEALERAFCGRCGAVAAGVEGERMLAPAGNFLEDPVTRPQAHIFVASKPPWFEILDTLPQHAAFPDDRAALPDRPPLDPPGRPRGSCLCGNVAYVVDGPPICAANCHCGRCRRGRAAAHASNLFLAAAGLRFTRGADQLAAYKVPEAKSFTQVFCRICGSKMPRLDPVRGIAVVPMGGLDDDPGIRPQVHIFTADVAPWFEIPDDGLPRYAASLPG